MRSVYLRIVLACGVVVAMASAACAEWVPFELPAVGWGDASEDIVTGLGTVLTAVLPACAAIFAVIAGVSLLPRLVKKFMRG